MSKYIDSSRSSRLLDATIRVYNTSVIKKIFSAIGDFFRKYFAGSFTAKIFTVFDFDSTQFEKSLVIKTIKRVLSPFIFVTNSIMKAVTLSAGNSVFVKLVRSCAHMTIIIFNGSAAGKMINHYLEGEN